MAEISIIVPVCNVEKYLAVCLDSILEQSYADFEVICMDDGSTDKSGNILDQYALKDKRIKVVHKKNSGYGSTMNTAIQLACGKYIGIVESDDIIEKDMYQILYDAAVKYDLDMVKTDFYRVWYNEKGLQKKQYFQLTDDRNMYNRVIDPNSEIHSYLLEKFTWNALYKKEMILKNNIRYNETPGASYQDNGFWFQTFYWSKRAMFLDQAFYYYRQDNMAASSHSRQKVYAMKNEFDFIRNFMISHNDQRQELYKICFHLRMRAYLFTLNRIDITLKLEFAEVMEKERLFFEDKDEACYQWMTNEQAAIVKDPIAYTKSNLIRCKNITKDVIRGFDIIIVYGAGAYGERAVNSVKEAKADSQKIRVAVTKLANKGMECQGEKVCEISECTAEKENSLVILAVKENSNVFHEMLEQLRKFQFPQIITVSAKRVG